MPLSPQSLLAELAKLEHARDNGCGKRQRQYERFIVRGEAELASMDRSRFEQVPISIQLRDIGRGGLGFLCQQELEVGSTWRVAFLRGSYVVGEQGLIIRYNQQIRDGLYLVGGQFCIETGLMSLLGVDTASLRNADSPAQVADPVRFLAPGEVA